MIDIDLCKIPRNCRVMGSNLGDLPSYDPHNFSQLKPSDPSNPSKMMPITYHPTHDRTLPPPDQDNRSIIQVHVGGMISTEAKNILVRHFYMRAEEKLKSKRAASDSLTPEQVRKHPRASTSEGRL